MKEKEISSIDKALKAARGTYSTDISSVLTELKEADTATKELAEMGDEVNENTVATAKKNLVAAQKVMTVMQESAAEVQEKNAKALETAESKVSEATAKKEKAA